MRNRQEMLQESILRDKIRNKILTEEKQRRVNYRVKLLTENKLRKVIAKVIQEEARNDRIYLTVKQINEVIVPKLKTINFGGKLNRVIAWLLNEGAISDATPHNSTGINILKDLLKKTVPVIESGYKMLTSNPEQRKSFRAHILNAVINSIAPPRALFKADIENLMNGKASDQDVASLASVGDAGAGNPMSQPAPVEEPGLENDIDLAGDGLDEPELGGDGLEPELGDEEMLGGPDETVPPEEGDIEALAESVLKVIKHEVLSKTLNEAAKISVDTDADADEEIDAPELETDPDKIPDQDTGLPSTITPDQNEKEEPGDQIKSHPSFLDVDKMTKNQGAVEDPKQEFGKDLQHTNETGKNVAFDVFQKIEKNIVSQYELIADSEDKQIFYVYLLVNLMLYFDKFEDELAPKLEDPNIPKYNEMKSGVEGELQMSGGQEAEAPGAEESLNEPELGGEGDEAGLGGLNIPEPTI